MRWRLYIHRSAVMLPPEWCELVQRASTDVLANARRLRKVSGADELRLVEALAARNSMSARAMLAVQTRMDAQVVEDVRAAFAGESMTRIDLATEKLDNDARKTDELAPEATIREVTETLRGLL